MKTLNFPSKDRVFKDLFARNPEQNLKKALEIYQRLLSHMDDRPAGARAATVCAISAGLERLTAETPQISVQRQAPVLTRTFNRVPRPNRTSPFISVNQ